MTVFNLWWIVSNTNTSSKTKMKTPARKMKAGLQAACAALQSRRIIFQKETRVSLDGSTPVESDNLFHLSVTQKPATMLAMKNTINGESF